MHTLYSNVEGPALFLSALNVLIKSRLLLGANFIIIILIIQGLFSKFTSQPKAEFPHTLSVRHPVQKTGKSRSLKKFGYTQDDALLFRPNCCPLLVHLWLPWLLHLNTPFPWCKILYRHIGKFVYISLFVICVGEYFFCVAWIGVLSPTKVIGLC